MFDPAIVLTLLFDGLTNGAIYAMMALGIVVLYSVTNVINVAQGEFVMLSALTVWSFPLRKRAGDALYRGGGLVGLGRAQRASECVDENAVGETFFSCSCGRSSSAAALFFGVPLLVSARASATRCKFSWRSP